MTKKAYGVEFGDWLGSKLNSSNEAEREEYLEKSFELVNQFEKGAVTADSPEQATKLVDTLMNETISMATSKLNLSKENWIFIASPEVDESASKKSRLEVQRGMKLALESLRLGYLPTSISSTVANTFENKRNGNLYYNILKNTQYPQLIRNDEWLKEYEAKKVVIDTAVRIAKLEKLYFDIKWDGRGRLESQNRAIKSLKYDQKFKIIDNEEVVGYKHQRSISELQGIVTSKTKEDYKAKFSHLVYAIRNLKSAGKTLNEKEEYLKGHPNTGWARQSVERAQQTVDKNENRLKQANIEFEETYNKDITKLNYSVQEIARLEANEESTLDKHKHNIQVFITTYEELLSKGYSEHLIEKFLCKDIQIGDFENYVNSVKNIKITDYIGVRFVNYMSTMKALL